MKQIRIEGEGDHLFDYEDKMIKASVVKLGSHYFWRSSDRVIKVEGRYFRIESPLIVKNHEGRLLQKKNAVEIAAGVYTHIKDPSLVKLANGDYSLRQYCFKINDSYYLKTDPNVAVCALSGEGVLKPDAIELDKDIYSAGLYIKPGLESSLVKTYKGQSILKRDAVTIISSDGERGYGYKHGDFILRVFNRFQNPNNPDFSRIKYANIPRDLYVKAKFIDHTYSTPATGVQETTIHEKDLDSFKNAVEFVNNVEKRESMAQVKDTLNKFYSGLDEKENKASRISLQYATHGGGVIYDPRPLPVISPKTKLGKVGGIGYTYGIELETSAGRLTELQCDNIAAAMHGDRSIGAFEYTSGILHGNLGIAQVKKLTNAINSRCLVDDRCGVHVHVGGFPATSVTNPNWGHQLAVLAIDLGCQLEPELYQMQPPSRVPDLKYCHSILRYKDISLSNWENVLGAYVFGKTEDEMTDEDLKGNYRIGGHYSMRDELNRWCAGRYKWLNVVNFCSRSRFKTLEFRIFAGSTDFDKIYNYILISLAFMWFIENRGGDVIRKGNTLMGVINAAYAKHPTLIERLQAFIDDRKNKYKRTKLYTN